MQSGSPGQGPIRRRRSVPTWFRSSARGRYLVAGSLIVLGALAVPVVTHAVSQRPAEVLVALRDLPPGHTIVRGDFGGVQVQAPSASVMSAAILQVLVGRAVRVEVPAGALLARGDLGAFPPQGQTTVPVSVKAGQYPPDLHTGQLVGVFPLSNGVGGAVAVAAPHAAASGRVLVVQALDNSSGGAVVELLVPDEQAPVVAQAAGVVLVGLDAAGDLP